MTKGYNKIKKIALTKEQITIIRSILCIIDKFLDEEYETLFIFIYQYDFCFYDIACRLFISESTAKRKNVKLKKLISIILKDVSIFKK